MNTRPRVAASAWAWDAASASVWPCSTTSAPQAAVRVTVVAGVKLGITRVAATPSRAAWRATAWAWLPADIAITPRARSSAVSSVSRLAAPRSLNAPVTWRLSSLSATSAPAARETASETKVGVRSTAPSMRAAASRTSASVITPRARSGEADFEDLVGTVTPGRGHRDGIAHLLADQRLGERRGHREPAQFAVSLVRAYDLVVRLPLGLLIDQTHQGTEFH